MPDLTPTARAVAEILWRHHTLAHTRVDDFADEAAEILAAVETHRHDGAEGQAGTRVAAVSSPTGTPCPDHPHTDPGDGRTECHRCGKYIWPAIHSCKGIPVTAAARARAASWPATSPGGRPVTLRVVSRQRRAPLLDPGDEDLDPPGRAATSPTGDPT